MRIAWETEQTNLSGSNLADEALGVGVCAAI
jgi:hypothetical protein